MRDNGLIKSRSTIMNAGDYVKWTGKDLFGKFQFFGQIIQLKDKDGWTKLKIPGVGYEVSTSDESDAFEVIAKPKNWDTLNQHTVPHVKPGMSGDRIFEDQPTVVKPVEKHVKTASTAVQAPSSKGDTKQRVIEAYNALKVDGIHPQRSAAIEKFISMGIGKNTASTYQYNCKSDWCK
jgi:hypothetical protein